MKRVPGSGNVLKPAGKEGNRNIPGGQVVHYGWSQEREVPELRLAYGQGLGHDETI